MKRGTLWFMTAAVGLIVANVYYIQPLLPAVARAFRITARGAGEVAMVMQLGTTCAMFLVVPLGDTRERRGLIAGMIVIMAAALIGVALAPNIACLCAAGAIVGASGSVVHLIIPYAAHLAPPQQRGQILGKIIGGLLLGIVLARTLSGWIGGIAGWRSVYWMAAGLMLVLAALTRICLPPSEPEIRLSYGQLVSSVAQLARDQPVLREASLQGAVFFFAFSAFWTTLAFRLESPPFHYGSAAAGLFGLVGAAGAAGAPLIGWIADRYGPRRAVGVALGAGVLSFVILWAGGNTLAGLIAGVLVLDLAVQAGHVANQTRIYSLLPAARSRLNTVYMTCYFIGGASGSLVGGWSWHLAQWPGVCVCGGAALLGGLACFWRTSFRPSLA